MLLYTLKFKHEVVQVFKSLYPLLERQFEKKILSVPTVAVNLEVSPHT